MQDVPEPTRSPSRRSALLALLLLVPAPTIGVLSAMVLWPGTVGTTIFAVAKAWMLLLPVIWHLAIDRQPFSLSPARRGGFGLGIGLGLVISGLILLAYALVGKNLIDPDVVRQEAIQNGIGTRTRFLLGALYWICINSVLEEYVYRWFIFSRLEVLLPVPVAVLGSALCFTIHHVIALGEQFDVTTTIIASVGIFIGGAVWSWMYARLRSIWPGYVSHAIVDVAVFGIGWIIIFGSPW